MASGITVKVAMRPLFVDYLKSIYYSDQNQIALQHTQLGILVKELLTKVPPNYKPKKYNENEYVELILPFYKDLNISYNNFLSENSEKIIRKWVQNKFYIDLRDHVENWKSMPGFEINLAINHFCDMHHINPDHYKTNSLYRDFYRYQQKKKTSQKMKKISSTFAAVLSIMLHLSVLPLSYLL
ncbi:hypothetical protein [Plebeiibacterium sediminum]|uniref:Uncharacterized protein n=1 Tax=Plebeiibacterium sediminum TaxID=2992112 RepID=A0AAE3M1D9_9BACT|nr:hypothetical protein [Plebeiobacterium sediminum]MCW3784914.1 hypothetical protein [Plebeiobacterium sediminum]